MKTLNVKLLDPRATAPTRGSEFAAGLDIYALTQEVIVPDETVKVSTGIAMEIPEGYVGLIKPRSGLAFNHGLDTLAGVIDSDYRGEVKVLMTSHATYRGEYIIEKGDRIAQLLLIPISMCDVAVVDELTDSVRGSGSYGSSGK